MRTYNELIPDPGELSGTLFIELTDDAELREWLPKFVERAAPRALRAGATARAPTPSPKTRSASRATTSPRPCTTSSSGSTPRAAGRVRAGPDALVVDHPDYHVVTELTDDQRAELAGDFA